MGCTNCGKASNLCGEKPLAACVLWEIPEDMQDCVGNECLLQSEANENIYERLCKVEQDIDLSTFESECINVEEDTPIKDIVVAIHNKLCDNLDANNICNILEQDIRECGIDYECLETTNECDEEVRITTLKELLQKMIVCEQDNTSCEELVWSRVINDGEETDLYYTVTCQNEVKLKGSISLDEIQHGSTMTTFSLPAPTYRRQLSVNAGYQAEDGIIACSVGVQDTGYLKLFYTETDLLSNNIVLYFDGQSYFLN